MLRRNHPLFLFAQGAVLFAFIAICSNTYSQQVYKGWKMTDKALQEATKSRSISTALQSGSIDKATFDSYFKTYYFHRWTQPGNLSQLNTFVYRDFLNTDLDKATGQARKDLLDIAFRALKTMKSDVNVHPAVRYNAIIALGQLYEEKEKKLYAPVLPVLIEEYDNTNSSDANKLGALIGIVNFAQIGIEDAQLRDATVPKLLQTLALLKTAPEGRADEIHQYHFRVHAVEGLGGLCRTAGAKPERVDALLTIISDNEELSDLRYVAARSLGEINYPAAATAGVKLDTDRILNAIITLLRNACTAEQKYLDEIRRTQQAKSSSGSSMTGGGMMSGGSSFESSSSTTSSSSYSSSSYGGEMGGRGDSKTNKIVEQCVEHCKFAFGAVVDSIEGYGGSRSDTGLITVFEKGTTPESKESFTKLNNSIKAIDEFIKILNNGPQGNKRSTRPTGSPYSTTPTSNSSGPSGRPLTGPKVAMIDIAAELDTLASRFDELFSAAGPNVAVKPGAATAAPKPASNTTGTDVAL